MILLSLINDQLLSGGAGATDYAELEGENNIGGDKLAELKAKVKDSRKTIYKITPHKMAIVAIYNPIYMTRLFILRLI